MSALDGQETDLGKILFERFVDLWNGEVDFADTPAFIADDFVVHSAELARYLGFPDSNRITTRDGLLDWVRSVRTLLDDVRFTTDPGPLRDGDYVSGGYTVTGRYAGGAPTATVAVGTPVRYTGMSIVRLEDDRLAEYWVLSDGLGLLSQLGAIPSP
ncbi:ester cyclase [Streptomyces cavernicola]|uniref:Nuclear transport factor 2 family protein n=1 Tax=Streptomyces cavernicola TaxID=3043613 RepID=A0ABT6SJZ1_9ACTN|nr:nuclear transport factor 2 family protein [Streptomyces sp. B-S-A6]MDI3408214.1 nuclear transport factor 2 family protein [Streptomyces sp. B-S-A6]